MPTRDDLVKRILSFKELKENWYNNEEGAAFDHAGLDWLVSVLPEPFPVPYCYPALDGRVLFEWPADSGCEADIVIDCKRQIGEWTWYNPHTKKGGDSKDIDLKNKKGWERLCDLLRKKGINGE